MENKIIIERKKLLDKIRKTFESCRMVCLLGPRQSGKTTMAQEVSKEYPNVHYFDLEDRTDFKRLKTPEKTLYLLRGLIIIDEIQHNSEIFSYLRYLHDKNFDQKFLILGSASQSLIEASSESLAGIVIYIEVTPFSLSEVNDLDKLWTKGGFPGSYLSEFEWSQTWLKNYRQTYFNRDLKLLDSEKGKGVFKKFWYLLAHYHGQTINYNKIASILGISANEVKNYINFLEDSFILRLLKPWHLNFKKRQMKNPKIYYRDSGLLHHSLDICTYEDIFNYERAGASFEGFAIEEVIKVHEADYDKCYFWTSDDGTKELDLLILNQGKKLGFEFKMADFPRLTQSMISAIEQLKLSSLTVICTKSRSYSLAENIKVISLEDYVKEKN